MFEKRLIIGHSEGKISDNFRIFLPTFTSIIPEDCLVFSKITFEEERALKIMAYNKYLEIIERFEILRNCAKSLEEYNKFSQEIEKLCFSLESVIEVDSQKRVALPKYAMEEYNWSIGDTIYYDGLGESVLIRKKNK